MKMMPGLILELPASGAVITIILFLMLENSTLLLTVTFLVVQQQVFEDMRVKNVELTRSMFERWKEAVLLLLCSLFQGACAAVTYGCLAFLLSDKWKSSFSVIMGWLCCSLDFSLLYSSLMCLHGSRSSSGSPGVLVAVDLIAAEGRSPGYK